MNQQPDLARHKNCVIYIFAALLTLLTLIGCGPTELPATPTPTKTPQVQAAEAAIAPTEMTLADADAADGTPNATVADTVADTAAATEDNTPSERVVESTQTATPAPTATTSAKIVIPPTSTAITIKPTPISPPENAAPYTGLAVADKAILTRQPIMFCINNDSRGRSQHHGLTQADLVYEYLMDGYVTTRLTALYHSRDADHIGPVRSARFPNVWMGEMYGGLLACSGGSDAIRYILRNEVSFFYLDGDLDDPNSNVYFFNVRDETTGKFDYRTRLRASTDGIRRWADQKGYTSTWDRPGFTYSQERPDRPSVLSDEINIKYPGGNSVRWVYRASDGGYIRYQGGTQQFDLENGEPIVAQNVIVMTTLHEVTDVIEDSIGTKGIDVKLYGINDVLIFRDGQVYAGTWQADATAPPRWNGFDGLPIPLKPGQSWVQAIRDGGAVSY